MSTSRCANWLKSAAFAFAACGVLLSSGCAPGRDLPDLPAYQARGYGLGAGDQIRIITFGEDELTGEFRVDDQGDIAVPLLGNVRASGLTPTQLGTRVSEMLKQKNLLRNPSVAVEVLAYRPVFVLGEVAKPGQYPYQPGMTVLTTVAIAGGYTYRAFDDYVGMVRTTGNMPVTGKAPPSALVAPGDVINVYERHF